MKKFYKLFVFLILINATQALRAQWSTISVPTTAHLFGVHFPSATVGYAVGTQGKIIKTTDAGLTWTLLSSGIDSTLFAVCFTDANTGVAVGEDGYIIRTTNGGSSWTVVNDYNTGNASDLTSVVFPSASIGYACGWGRCVLKTTDGGLTWTRQTPNGIRSYRGISAWSTTNVVTVGYDQGLFSATVLRTSNGSSWTGGITSGLAWNTVHFPVQDTGYSFGAVGDAHKSIDGGVSWTTLSVPSNGAYLYGCYFLNSREGYVVGMNEHIFKTNDGGATWFSSHYNSGTRLESVFFINKDIGIAVGESGKVLRTASGSVIAVAENSVHKSKTQVYPNPMTESATIAIGSDNFKSGEHYSVDISDVIGNIVRTYNDLTVSEVTIDKKDLSPGIYLYTFKFSGKKPVSGKLIIQ